MSDRAVFKRLVSPVSALLTIAACLTAGAMVSLVTVEVAARYLLGSSIYFATEIAQLMFVWTVFLGLPLALVRGRHVGINISDTVLPPSAAIWLRRAAMLCSIGLLLVIAWKCWEMMIFNWDQRLMTVRLSGGLYYLPVIIGAVSSIYFLLVGLVPGRIQLIDVDGD